MRTTTDLLTGSRFRWNATITIRDGSAHDGLVTPARESTRGLTWLHPSRVPVDLLRELNPGGGVR